MQVEINAEHKNLPFHQFKKGRVNIRYHSKEFLVSFSEVPDKLQLTSNSILLNVSTGVSTESIMGTFVLICWFSCFLFLLFVCVSRVFGSINWNTQEFFPSHNCKLRNASKHLQTAFVFLFCFAPGCVGSKQYNHVDCR